MPKSKTTKTRKHRKHRRQQGKGPALDWLKKTARTIHDYVKDKKLISRGLTGLSHIASPYSSHLATASKVASTLGYGKRHSKTHGRHRKHKTRK